MKDVIVAKNLIRISDPPEELMELIDSRWTMRLPLDGICFDCEDPLPEKKSFYRGNKDLRDFICTYIICRKCQAVFFEVNQDDITHESMVNFYLNLKASKLVTGEDVAKAIEEKRWAYAEALLTRARLQAIATHLVSVFEGEEGVARTFHESQKSELNKWVSSKIGQIIDFLNVEECHSNIRGKLLIITRINK